MMIPLEWMPPLMFAGLVVFMIIGYPVAFSLAALGFFFGMISIDRKPKKKPTAASEKATG